MLTPSSPDPKGRNGSLLPLRRRSPVTRIAGHPTASSHVVVNPDGRRTALPTRENAMAYWQEADMPWDLLAGGEYGWVVVGHLPSDHDGQIICRLIRTAVEHGLPVSWTPGSTQLACGVACFASVLPLLRLLVLNREEGARFCGLPADSSARELAEILAGYCHWQTLVVVTDGGVAPAVAYAGADKICYWVPPLAVSALDATGAGDAFHTGLVVGLRRAMDAVSALSLARQWAAAICTIWGASVDGDFEPQSLLAGIAEPPIIFEPLAPTC